MQSINRSPTPATKRGNGAATAREVEYYDKTVLNPHERELFYQLMDRCLLQQAGLPLRGGRRDPTSLLEAMRSKAYPELAELEKRVLAGRSIQQA